MVNIMLQSLGATLVIGGLCQWSDGEIFLLLVGEKWVRSAEEKKEGPKAQRCCPCPMMLMCCPKEASPEGNSMWLR
jgi:hypothetical protein